MLSLLYPMSKRISDVEVVRWAHSLLVEDALAEAGQRDADPFSDPAAASASDVPLPSLKEAIGILEDRGKARFAEWCRR
jgi:hypothetical protein